MAFIDIKARFCYKEAAESTRLVFGIEELVR